MPESFDLGKHYTRRQEIDSIFEHAGHENLTEQQKIDFGVWLEKRGSQLQAKVEDGDKGITKADVIEAYSSAKWGSGTKFLWNDMKMLKQVAAHFDELALAGQSSSVIDKEDIAALKGNARVTRTKYDVTSDYPDGRLYRRTANGDIYTRSADGSMNVHNSIMSMNLDNSTGKGMLEMQPATGGYEKYLQSEPIKFDLEKHSDGTWWGKDKQGNEMQLSVDEHSTRVTMSDMDMLITTKGGFLRDPTDPSFVEYINADGSLTVIEEGKTHDVGTSEDGVTRVRDDDGTNWYQYPIDPPVSMKVEPDNAMHIGGGGPIPRIDTTADGKVSVSDGDGKKLGEGQPKADGTTTVELPDKLRSVTREKCGDVTVHFKSSDGSEMVIKMATNGTLSIKQEDGSIEFVPPELRRPR